MDSKLKVAAACVRVVYGLSGFMEAFLNNQLAQKKKLELYYVDTTVSKEEAQKFRRNPLRELLTFLHIDAKHEAVEGMKVAYTGRGGWL
jgi:hypothetical protein